MRIFPLSTGPYLTWIILAVLLCLDVSACSRSKWIKSDGQSVSGKEQLVCAEEIKAQHDGQILEHEEMMAKVEACMTAKGYHLRPWWSFNDLRWDIRSL